ncbi:topoisomerase C-terminal repeat-containing protein, partial [Rhizorhabdus wittichii]
VTGSEVKLMAGRFGPYVTDGETNATLPKTANPDELTAEAALELLAARAAKGPPAKGKKKAPAKKAAPKKAAAKK